MIKIELDDKAFRGVMAQLKAAGSNLRPLLARYGEHLTETTKQRFATSRSPDGDPWAPNTFTTLDRYLGKFKGSYDTHKDRREGRLTKKGAGRAMAKKPLIGETRALSTTINYRATDQHVEIGSPMVYAAVQQFGAKARSFTGGKSPWGDIPARPFLGLSAQDREDIVRMAREYLARAAGGVGA